MPHTFDIRFTRTTGLASLLAAPENPFRWKGCGRLSIDGQKLSIAVERSLSTLFSASLTRHFDADDLAEVYREGDALRLEFNAPDARRVVMPFWARDREAAAEIVRLMPTQRTVELEESLVNERRRFRVDVPLVACLAGVVLLIAIATPALVGFRSFGAKITPVDRVERPEPQATVPAAPPVAPPAVARMTPDPVDAPVATTQPDAAPGDASARIPDEPAAAEPASIPGTDSVAPGFVLLPVVSDGVVAIMPGDPAYAAARRLADQFDLESSRLLSQYLYERTPMPDIEKGWWTLTQSLFQERDSADRALRPLIDAELAASQSWRNALWLHEEARRRNDRAALALAAGEFENARQLTDRVKRYVH